MSKIRRKMAEALISEEYVAEIIQKELGADPIKSKKYDSWSEEGKKNFVSEFRSALIEQYLSQNNA